MFDNLMKTLGSAAVLSALAKAVGTAAVVLVISEIGKRWTALGAAITALPLMTMLVVGVIALDTKDGGTAKATEFASSTFYLFWPGLTFFVVLLIAPRMGISFWWSFVIAVVATFAVTWGAVSILTSLGLLKPIEMKAD